MARSPIGFLSKRLTYANVLATLALFLALGGTSYAVTALPSNSVGTTQLKKNAVTAVKIKSNAVTGSKVKNGSLTAADFAAGTLVAGPAGPAGATGATGAAHHGAPVSTGTPSTMAASAPVLLRMLPP